MVAYIVVTYLAARAIGHADSFTLLTYPKTLIDIGLPVGVLVICARFVRMMVVDRPDRLFAAFWTDLRNIVFSPRPLRNALPILALFILFMSAFTSMKGMIPAFRDYSWDQAFMRWDQVVHLGWHPWQLFEPVFHYPIVTFAINVVYNVWFFVMLSVLFWQIFSLQNPFLRMRFLWVFFASWIIGGNLLATLFSSAGPCYYDVFGTGENPYVTLLEYLRLADESFPIWALTTQTALLDAHTNNTMGIGVGISAMPSMHVATATLFALVGMQTNRVLGVILVIFAVLIYLGSIHLAWHYAVDGIAGVLLTLALWWAAGHILARDEALIAADRAAGQ